MLNFTRDYPDAETVTLDVNYRCSGQILSAAMHVIGENKKRFSKKLSTPNQVGKAVQIREFQNPREEYLAVVSELRERMENGERLEDTAILLRTNQEAEGLVGALMERQVPFNMKEKLPNLFQHWICRNLLAYMHFAAGDWPIMWILKSADLSWLVFLTSILYLRGLQFVELRFRC